MSWRPSKEGRHFRQQDYKPSSVSQFSAGKACINRNDGHPSGTAITHGLVRPTREQAGHPMALLFGLAPGGVYPAGRLPGPLVRSYRTVSPLPLRCRKGGLSLWHYPSRRRAWALPSTLPCGARTFLPGIHQGDRPSSCLINSSKRDSARRNSMSQSRADSSSIQIQKSDFPSVRGLCSWDDYCYIDGAIRD